MTLEHQLFKKFCHAKIVRYLKKKYNNLSIMINMKQRILTYSVSSKKVQNLADMSDYINNNDHY